MNKEMNFFDLCVACGNAIGRCCKFCGRVLARMARLTYRYWWIVLTIMALAIAAALYYTRSSNTIYRVNAVAMINGGSIQQFEQAFAPLRSPNTMPDDAVIKPFVYPRAKAMRFTTFRVIDCLDDGTPDYIDFKRKVQPTDTVKVIMQDRLCLQFRIKQRDLDSLPQIEEALMEYLNANEALQQSYKVYASNLRNEVSFNHKQALKLDSLTSHYYFYSPSGMEPNAYVGTGVNFYGDRRISLFLDEIYEQHEQLQMKDYRYHLTTAPVVLENHFAIDDKVANGRRKFCILFLLLGWFAGCALAELIDKRKALNEWLKA